MPKTILITGTSSGLGLALAVQAAKAGHKVCATMRDIQKRDALDQAAKASGVPVSVRPLDVQSTASVEAAMAEFLSEHGRIDTLVCNAGAGFVRSTEQAREDDIDWVMDVNFRGVVRCVKAALPAMRERRAGHVVAITSVGGLVGQPFNEFYCAAKFAVEGYIESLASYVTPSFGIDFTLVEPGGISSAFASSVLQQVERSGGLLDDEYRPILERYIGRATARQDGADIYQTPDEVAAVVLGCIEADAPPIRTRTSRWSEEFTRLKTGLDPDGKKQQADVIERFL